MCWKAIILDGVLEEAERKISSHIIEDVLEAFKDLCEMKCPTTHSSMNPLWAISGPFFRFKPHYTLVIRGIVAVVKYAEPKNGKRGALILLEIRPRDDRTYDIRRLRKLLKKRGIK